MRQLTVLLLTGLLSLQALTGCARSDRADQASFLAAAQASIAAREYRASQNGEGLQAPNRAHNLRTYFDSHGIRVVDRTAPGAPECDPPLAAQLPKGVTPAPQRMAPGGVIGLA